MFKVDDAELSPEALAFWCQLALDTAPLVRYRAERAAREDVKAREDDPNTRRAEFGEDLVRQAVA